MNVFRTAHIHLMLVATLALQPLTAAAQTTPTFSVTVTESTELVEEVGTTRRIGREEIESRNARTLDEALRLLPGIYVRTGGDGTPRIDIRGFRSRHVLLLINGVQVNSTADGQFDPARISTETIREIKVSYGSSSVLYGDNALAGVIEITTVDEMQDASLNVSGGTPIRKASAAASPGPLVTGRSCCRARVTTPTDTAFLTTSRRRRSRMAAGGRTAIAIVAISVGRSAIACRRRC